MKHLLYTLALLVVCTGCSATGQKLSMEESGQQYCETDKTIIDTNGSQDVTQITKCSDNIVKKLLPPKMGLGKNCREHEYEIFLNRSRVTRKGYACLFKGKDYESSKWYIVTSPY